MPEYFMQILEVKKVVIVNDFRFLPEGADEMVEVKPVTFQKMVEDQNLLREQVLYVFPQPGDMQKKIFHVHYVNTKII